MLAQWAFEGHGVVCKFRSISLKPQPVFMYVHTFNIYGCMFVWVGVWVCVYCKADLCLHKSWNRSSHNSDHPFPSPHPAYTPRPCHPLNKTGKGSIFFLMVLDRSKVVPVLVNNISLAPLARLPRSWHPGIRLYLGWNHWKCDWEYEWLSACGLPTPSRRIPPVDWNWVLSWFGLDMTAEVETTGMLGLWIH